MKLVPVALCAVSLVLCFPAVAQDKKPLSKEVKALIEKAEKGDAKAQVSPGEKSAFGIAKIVCEDIAPRIEP